MVPNDAVAARLCKGLIDNGGFNQLWPADTMEDRYVDRLVARLNGLTRYAQPEFCNLVGGAYFAIVLSYPDGSTVWVDGNTAGNCAHLQVQGGEAWAGADDVLRFGVRLIEDQRAAIGRPAGAEPARCPHSWQNVYSTFGAEPITAKSRVAVTVCRYRLGPPEPMHITQSWDGRLKTEQTIQRSQRLLDLVTRGSRFDPCNGHDYDLDRIQDVLLFRDAFGDQHVVSTTPCWPSQATGSRRYPLETLTNGVGRLLTSDERQ